MDTVNWGEALTKSMIEKAELVRYSMECKFTLNAKLKQQVDMVVGREYTNFLMINLFQQKQRYHISKIRFTFLASPGHQ